jgi:hypothetical protein
MYGGQSSRSLPVYAETPAAPGTELREAAELRAQPQGSRVREPLCWLGISHMTHGVHGPLLGATLSGYQGA